MIASCSSAGWLVEVFSLVSNWTAVLPEPVISIPKLVPGLASQD
jgi:hypothetical protein